MKFVFASDLHLEHGPLPHGQELPDGDVFVLAGDICDYDRVKFEEQENMPATSCRLYTLLQDASEKYGSKNIIYVPGNHEYYGTYQFKDTPRLFNVILEKTGLHEDSHHSELFLQEENVKITEKDGLKILSGSMWTSYDSHNPVQMVVAQRRMNDYRMIRVPDYESQHYFRYLDPKRDVYPLNQEFIAALYEHQPDVVISHHTPHRKCNDFGHGYGNEHMYYCTDAQKYLESEQNRTKLWICGHTHDPVDFTVNGTRIVNNPRGYKGYEQIAEEFSFKVVEV